MNGLCELVEKSIKPLDLLIMAFNSVDVSRLSNYDLTQYYNIMDNGYTEAIREKRNRGI